MSKVRLVLDGEEDIAQVMYDLSVHLGWELAELIEPTDNRPGGFVFFSPEKYLVSFVDDFILDVAYVVLKMEDANTRQAIANTFSIIDEDQAKELAQKAIQSKDIETLAHAVSCAVIVTSSDAEPWVLELFRHAFEHEHAGVRLRAVQALTYTGLDREEGKPWPQLIEAVRTLQNDINPAVSHWVAEIIRLAS